MMQALAHVPRKLQIRRPWLRVLYLVPFLIGCLLGKWAIAWFVPARASPILSTRSWAGQGPPGDSWCPYRWLANDDLAFLEKDGQGRLQVCYQRMERNAPVGAPRHGPILPADASPYCFYPSPDEQWVAYETVSSKFEYRIHLISADGKTLRTISPQGSVFYLWLSDSRSFLTNNNQDSALKVHHLDTPQPEPIPELSRQCYPLPMSTLAPGPNFLIGGDFGPTHDTAVFMKNYPTMPFRSYNVSNPAAAPQTWQVTVPTETDEGRGAVSPDNRHILWFTSSWKPSFIREWFYRKVLQREIELRGKATHRCFLSDLHGNDLHPVLNGIMDGTRKLNPVWTPDSRHVSFIYQNQLYLVPID